MLTFYYRTQQRRTRQKSTH